MSSHTIYSPPFIKKQIIALTIKSGRLGNIKLPMSSSPEDPSEMIKIIVDITPASTDQKNRPKNIGSRPMAIPINWPFEFIHSLWG